MFLKVLIICLLSVNYCTGYYIEYEDTLPVQNQTKYTLNLYDMIDWNVFNNNNNVEYESEDSEPADVQPHHHDHDQDVHPPSDEDEEFGSWSIVWYIASFGGLIAFFLIVSCSEWCCRKRIRESQTARPTVSPSAPTPTLETPPPAYDLFAPPSYDSVKSSSNNEKNEFDIYVVPVHALGSLVQNQNSQQEENPPSYTSINCEENTRTATTT